MQTTESVMQRVRDLLRLSTSSNPNEAATAAALAEQLIAKHRLERAALEVDDEGLAEDVTKLEDATAHNSRTDRWKGVLIHNVAKHYSVASLAVPRGKTRHSIELYGTHSDISLTLTMYGWLTGEIERLCRLYMKGSSAVDKRQYKLGACVSVIDALKATARREQAANSVAQGAAIVLVKRYDSALALMRGENPVTRKGRAVQSNGSNAYYAGRRDGSTIRVDGSRTLRLGG